METRRQSLFLVSFSLLIRSFSNTQVKKSKVNKSWQYLIGVDCIIALHCSHYITTIFFLCEIPNCCDSAQYCLRCESHVQFWRTISIAYTSVNTVCPPFGMVYCMSTIMSIMSTMSTIIILHRLTVCDLGLKHFAGS